MSKHPFPSPSAFDAQLLRQALKEACKKLDPRSLWRNPVMFAVEIASAITLLTFLLSLTGRSAEPTWFTGSVSLSLWATVAFCHLCRSLGRGPG